MIKCDYVKSFGLMFVISLFLTVCPAVSDADLIVTEWMADPSALSDTVGEYFEVFNSMAVSIDVDDLTLSDDGSNSVTFSGTGLSIGPGSFLVFGSSAQSYVDINWKDTSIATGTFALVNTSDEIVVSLSGSEIGRVNYSDGNPFGPGTAAVLNDIANATGGVAQFSDYIAEIAANDTLPTADIGSPGVAGSTAVPEPSAYALGGIICLLIGATSLLKRTVVRFLK